MSGAVAIREVLPRDGFQDLDVGTEQTVAALHTAGVRTGVQQAAIDAAATEIRRLLDEVTEHDPVPAA